MKVLACYNLTEARQDKTTSPVEIWRIKRPIEALQKNTDWHIEESMGIFPEAKKAIEVTDKEMQDRIDYFSQFDIVWGSYYTNPFIHAFTMVAQQKTKTKFAVDVDDNMFAIDPLNPIHMTLDKKYLEFLKMITLDANYLTTTTEVLAEMMRDLRTDRPRESVVVIPNMIPTSRYKNSVERDPNVITIGYIGGSSHYADLHHTNMVEALRDIMHKNKHVRVQAVGMFIDKYLPKARYEFIGGERDNDKYMKMYSELKFDIGIAPLEDTPFTECKSNIKWQEYSLMGIPTIASKAGPYKDTIKHGSDGWLVDNTYDAWYNAFNVLIENATLRKRIGDNAKRRVESEFSIEKNYTKIQEGLEAIAKL